MKAASKEQYIHPPAKLDLVCICTVFYAEFQKAYLFLILNGLVRKREILIHLGFCLMLTLGFFFFTHACVPIVFLSQQCFFFPFPIDNKAFDLVCLPTCWYSTIADMIKRYPLKVRGWILNPRTKLFSLQKENLCGLYAVLVQHWISMHATVKCISL